MLKHNRTLPSPHYEPATNTHGEGEIGCKDTTNKNGMRRNGELYLLFLMSTFRDQLLIEFFRCTHNNHISYLTRAFFSKIKPIFLLAQFTPVSLPGPTDYGRPTRKQIANISNPSKHTNPIPATKRIHYTKPLSRQQHILSPLHNTHFNDVTKLRISQKVTYLHTPHKHPTHTNRTTQFDTITLSEYDASTYVEAITLSDYDITAHDTNTLHIQV